MSNYEEKKHGFRLTKADHEARDKQKKHERFLNQIAKIDPQQAQKDLDALNRSVFLAPHQQERRKLLERAVAHFRREANAVEEAQKAKDDQAAAAAAQYTVQPEHTVVGNQNRRKRQRSDSDSDDSDGDDTPAGSSTVGGIEVDSSQVHTLWSAVLANAPAGSSNPSMKTNAIASKPLSFVPRVVARTVALDTVSGGTTSAKQSDVEKKMLQAAKDHVNEDMDDFLDNL